jgi:ankyrin repeat protein
MVQLLLEAHADPNLVSSRHGKPLSMAAASGNWQMVQLLLRAGAAPDGPDSSGSSPLHLAARSGEVRTAQLLLGAGADSNHLDSSGLAPLHLAVSAGSVLMVHLLVHWPTAIVDVSSSASETPLLAAIKAASGPHATADSLEVVEVLLQGGADPLLSSMALQQATGAQEDAGAPAAAVQPDGDPDTHSDGASSGSSTLDAAQGPGTAQGPGNQALPAGVGFMFIPYWRAAMEEWTPSSSSSSSSSDKASSDCDSLSNHSSYQGEEEADIDDATRARWACPLQLALDSKAYPVAALLLRHMARQGLWDGPNAYHTTDCGTLLHAAALHGDLVAADLLLRSGAVVDAVWWSRREEGSTPLLLAVEQGRLSMVERLLAAGADPNVHLGQQLTTLKLAMVQGRPDLASLLLKWGANPNPGGGCLAGTPLQLAVLQGEVSLMEQLVAAGAQPDTVCIWNHTTPLQLAVASRCPRSVQLLLEHGADPYVVEVSSGDTLLHVAVRGSSSSSSSNSTTTTSSSSNSTTTTTTTTSSSSSIVGALLAAGAAPNEVNRAGDTPLLLAVQEGQEDAAKQLLQDPGVDASLVNSSSTSALHYAARSGSSSIVPGLLQRGAQVAATDGRGLTPLHHASFMGHRALVQQLLRSRADVRAFASGGAGTPLQLAIAAQQWEVVGCLLAWGAAAGMSAAGTSSTSSSSMASCLHLAAEVGHVPTITRLLKAGVDPCAVNSRGELPSHLAARAGHTEAAVLLMSVVKSPCLQYLNHVSNDAAAAVHLAAAGGHAGTLDVLLQQEGVEVDLVGAKGKTALHLAASEGHLECVKQLVAAGANRDAEDAEGATPLHLAPLAEQPQLVPLLATTKNINNMVGATTVLHTAAAAAAGRSVELVAAVLAAGGSLTAANSARQSALTMIHQQGDPALFMAVFLHLLRSHPTATLPLGQEVVAAEQVYLGMQDACIKQMFVTVMEVLGSAAAQDLWRQMVQQQQSRTASSSNPGHQQQQQRTGQEQQDMCPPGTSKQGVVTELRRHQQQLRLDYTMVKAMQEGWLAAWSDLAQQREGLIHCLRQAASSSSQQCATTAAPSAGCQLQQAAVEQAAGSTAVEAAAQWKLVPPAAIREAAAAGTVKRQALQELLQQQPPVALKYVLATALEAAAAKGHEGLCVQLLQQLAATHHKDAAEVVYGVVSELESSYYTCVRALGPGSLTLCGALLGAWQEVRQQQQQELVDAVVSAVEAWQQGRGAADQGVW